MKIIIERDVLLGPLQALSGILDRRSAMPILGQVLVIAEDASITLCATDMEVELRIVVDCPANAPGDAALPGRKLLDICRSLPTEVRIEIELSGTSAVLRSGRSRFSLQTLPASEFPSMREFVPEQRVSLPGKPLRLLIEATQFSMASQDVRYYLNGLLVEFGPGRMRAVATDGHRLALRDVPMDVSLDHLTQLIVPRKGVAELYKVLGSFTEEVQLSVGGSYIQAQVGNQTFTSKLIDGRFPDYERVLPAATDKIVIADRETLRAGLARSAILCSERFKGVRISLEPDLLRASTQNADREEAEEEIPVSYSGERLEIGFNVSYLIDCLSAIKTESVRLEFKDVSSGCLIKPEGEPDSLYVVMPMRV